MVAFATLVFATRTRSAEWVSNLQNEPRRKAILQNGRSVLQNGSSETHSAERAPILQNGTFSTLVAT
jgi:hypothetical protein